MTLQKRSVAEEGLEMDSLVSRFGILLNHRTIRLFLRPNSDTVSVVIFSITLE